MQGVFLVSHGSSSPTSLEAVQKVRDALRTKVSNLPIEAGCLEGQSRSLSVQIEEFINKHHNKLKKLSIIPLFLVQGCHVSEDIPQAVRAELRAELRAEQGELAGALEIEVAPYLGSYPVIPQLLIDKFQQVEQHMDKSKLARLIIGHGSNLSRAIDDLETLKTATNSELAMWTQRDAIPKQVEQILSSSKSHLLVMPYFLFEGKVTELIREIISPYSAQVTYMNVPFSPQEIAELVISNQLEVSLS